MSTGETKKYRNQEVVTIYEQIEKWLHGKEVVVLQSHVIAITYRCPAKPVLIVYDFKRSLRPLARVVERGELALLAPFYEERELMERLVELLAVVAKKPETYTLKGDITLNGSFGVNLKEHTHSRIEPTQVESFHSSNEPTDVAGLLDKHFEGNSSRQGRAIHSSGSLDRIAHGKEV